MRQWLLKQSVFVFAIVFACGCLLPITAESKDVLVFGMQDATKSLDPAVTYETSAYGILGQIYERLVTFEGDDLTKIVPALAESWDVGADQKTWTFHLRQNVTFANGKPVNADAVVFSLQRAIKLNQSPAWLLTQFGMTEAAITKIDDVTIQLALDKPYAPGLFLSCLAAPVASILEPSDTMAHEQNGDMGSAWLEDHSVGSGPFILTERKREAPAQYLLTANEAYWKKKPIVKQLLIKVIDDASEQAALLEQGTIDVAWNLTPEQITQLTQNNHIVINETLTLNVGYLGMNLGYEPLKKSEVRQAIRYAIDYNGLIKQVFQGAAVPLQTFVPKGLLGYNPSQPYRRDAEKAAQLLAEGGYPDGFDVELTCLNFSPWIEMAMKIKRDLDTIKIKVTVKQLSAEQMMEAVWNSKTATQLYVWDWLTDYPDPDCNAKGFGYAESLDDNAPVKLLNWWLSYKNLETSKSVDDAMQEADQQQREMMYQEISDKILQDGPFAILYTPMHQYAIRTDVAEVFNTPKILAIMFPQLK